MVGTARVVQAAVLFLKRQAAHLDVHVALNDRNDPDVSKWVLPTSKNLVLLQKKIIGEPLIKLDWVLSTLLLVGGISD